MAALWQLCCRSAMNIAEHCKIENFAIEPKEPLINTFLPFFVTLSVTDFRVFLKTAKRTLHFYQRIPNITVKEFLYMKDLLNAIVDGLVEDKDSVKIDVDEPNEEGVTVYHLHVAQEDMGRVIGKQGRIAKAIRTVMRAGAGRKNQKIAVEID